MPNRTGNKEGKARQAGNLRLPGLHAYQREEWEGAILRCATIRGPEGSCAAGRAQADLVESDRECDRCVTGRHQNSYSCFCRPASQIGPPRSSHHGGRRRVRHSGGREAETLYSILHYEERGWHRARPLDHQGLDRKTRGANTSSQQDRDKVRYCNECFPAVGIT
jgi:hypothetical protein